MEWISDTRETSGRLQARRSPRSSSWATSCVVVLALSARGGGSGVPVAQELAVLWKGSKDGKAIEARSFTSRREALEAAGVTGD